jgi:hypothetical protein
VDELGAIVPNAHVAAGTCLYASDGGEAIGFTIVDTQAQLDPSPTAGWFTLSLGTPWGPIAFAARGPNEKSLSPCGPAASP